MNSKGRGENILPQNVPWMTCGFFWAADNWNPTDTRIAYYPLSLNCLKELRWKKRIEMGTYTRKRAIPRDNFLCQKHLSTWHGKPLFSKYLLFSSSCELSSSLQSPGSLPLLSSGWYVVVILNYSLIQQGYFLHHTMFNVNTGRNSVAPEYVLCKIRDGSSVLPRISMMLRKEKLLKK